MSIISRIIRVFLQVSKHPAWSPPPVPVRRTNPGIRDHNNVERPPDYADIAKQQIRSGLRKTFSVVKETAKVGADCFSAGVVSTGILAGAVATGIAGTPFGMVITFGALVGGAGLLAVFSSRRAAEQKPGNLKLEQTGPPENGGGQPPENHAKEVAEENANEIKRLKEALAKQLSELESHHLQTEENANEIKRLKEAFAKQLSELESDHRKTEEFLLDVIEKKLVEQAKKPEKQGAPTSLANHLKLNAFLINYLLPPLAAAAVAGIAATIFPGVATFASDLAAKFGISMAADATTAAVAGGAIGGAAGVASALVSGRRYTGEPSSFLGRVWRYYIVPTALAVAGGVAGFHLAGPLGAFIGASLSPKLGAAVGAGIGALLGIGVAIVSTPSEAAKQLAAWQKFEHNKADWRKFIRAFKDEDYVPPGIKNMTEEQVGDLDLADLQSQQKLKNLPNVDNPLNCGKRDAKKVNEFIQRLKTAKSASDASSRQAAPSHPMDPISQMTYGLMASTNSMMWMLMLMTGFSMFSSVGLMASMFFMPHFAYMPFAYGFF